MVGHILKLAEQTSELRRRRLESCVEAISMWRRRQRRVAAAAGN
jgi:hypothetical protein